MRVPEIQKGVSETDWAASRSALSTFVKARLRATKSFSETPSWSAVASSGWRGACEVWIRFRPEGWWKFKLLFSPGPTAVVVDLSIVGAAEREIVGSTHDRYLVSE